MMLAKLSRFIPMASFGGAMLVGVCCLRIPMLVSLLAAVGLAFLLKDVVLLPLMVFFLTAMLISLGLDYRLHRRKWPLGLAFASSVALLFFALLCRAKLPLYLALAGVAFSRTASAVFRRKAAPACQA